MTLDEKLERNENDITATELLLRFEKSSKPSNTKDQLMHAEQLIELYKERCRLLAQLSPL